MAMRRTIFEPEHDTFRDGARRFFQAEIAPHAERWRKQGMVDREAYRKAGEQGYLLMWADEKYGGAGVADFRYEQVLIEENIRHGEPCFYLNLHSRLVGPYFGQLGNEEQKARFLPSFVQGEKILAVAMTEPGAGSDVAGMKTRAEDKGDHWLLNGSKTYISNGQLADVVVVAARTVPDQRYGIGLFIVERGMDGFERGRHLQKIGLHAQDTSELFFKDVKVPKANVLGDPAKGFHYLTHFLAEERLIGSVQYTTGAQLAWDLTLDWVKERRMFGKPLGAFQNTRFKLAELRADRCRAGLRRHARDRAPAGQAERGPRGRGQAADQRARVPHGRRMPASSSAARATWRSTAFRGASRTPGCPGSTPVPRK